MTVEAAVIVRDMMLAGHSPETAMQELGISYGANPTWPKVIASLITRLCVQAGRGMAA